MRRLAIFVTLAFIIALFFPRCAVVQSPTGGPKDTIPPVLVRSIPALNSTSFENDRVIFTFNEFIKLDKISEKLVLSPPQERLPDFKIKGKSLELRFSEPLLDSTTYTLYFADAIVDNNEDNKLENFEFAFSTGPVIDSLRVGGFVMNAFTNEPKEGAFVFLYSNFNDSVPYNSRPNYVTKTNKEGRFILSNLRKSDYKIFALVDGNSNYKFDQVSEEIAFLPFPVDTSLLLTPSQPLAKGDSLLILRLFQEANPIQALTDFSRKQRRSIALGFSRPPIGDIKLSPLNIEVDSSKSWFTQGRNAKGDSLMYWITQNSISNTDSLLVSLTYKKTDSLMNLIETTDTLRLFYFERAQTTSRSRRKEEQEPEKPLLPVNISVSNDASLTPKQIIGFSFNMPLLSIDTTLIDLKCLTDSSRMPLSSFRVDTLDPRRYSLQGTWKPTEKYSLSILPNAFINLDGVTNDTMAVKFKGADPEQYGIINLNISGVTPNVIVELTTEKGVAVDRKVINADGIYPFTFIKPGKYQLRLIKDGNQNGTWDTGHYLRGVQPEGVFIYRDKNKVSEIQVRSNWEYDLSFNLNKPYDVNSDELRNVPDKEEREPEPVRGKGFNLRKG